MARYVSIDEIDKIYRKLGCGENEIEIAHMIEGLPTVDAVEVVHGKWLSAYEYALKIGVTDEERLEEAKRDMWWKFCNNCEQQVKGVHNYCPNCGEKMDGRNE